MNTHMYICVELESRGWSLPIRIWNLGLRIRSCGFRVQIVGFKELRISCLELRVSEFKLRIYRVTRGWEFSAGCRGSDHVRGVPRVVVLVPPIGPP